MAVWVVSLSTKDVSTHGVSDAKVLNGIRSLVKFGRVVAPLVYPVLYPRQYIKHRST